MPERIFVFKHCYYATEIFYLLETVDETDWEKGAAWKEEEEEGQNGGGENMMDGKF